MSFGGGRRAPQEFEPSNVAACREQMATFGDLLHVIPSSHDTVFLS